MLFTMATAWQRRDLRLREIQVPGQHLIHPCSPPDRVGCTEQATQSSMGFGGIKTESKLLKKSIDTCKINHMFGTRHRRPPPGVK